MSRVDNELLNIIKDQNSPPEKVRNAFACLSQNAGKDFIEIVRLLCENHPVVAEDFLPMMPERFIPKDFACAADGYLV